MRQLLPPWMPAVGPRRRARQHRAGRLRRRRARPHQPPRPSIDKRCFHLVDPVGYRVGDVLDIFSRAAHAPKMNLFVNAALLGFIPKSVKKGLMALAPVRRIRNAVMKDLGLPEDMLTFVNYPTRFDCRETLAALKGSGIECPNLKDYAWRLWDYWERHLDPDLHIDRIAARHGRRQGGAGHRRLVGHRPGGGAQVRRGRRDHHHLRPRPGQAGRGLQGDAEGRQGLRSSSPTRPTSPTWPTATASSQLLIDEPRRRRLPDQQRRPLDPPRDRGELRPLPRLRAHDAAQLLRLPARDDGPAARHGGEAQGPRRQHQLDRRADQRAALLGLRRLARRRWTRGRAAPPASSPTRASPSPPSTCRWCARR